MDQASIQLAANRLEAIASSLIRGGDLNVKTFYSSLMPLVTRAKNGEILEPIEWRHIPGGYAFLHGDLHEYAALESAFANFRIALTGPWS